MSDYWRANSTKYFENGAQINLRDIEIFTWGGAYSSSRCNVHTEGDVLSNDEQMGDALSNDEWLLWVFILRWANYGCFHLTTPDHMWPDGPGVTTPDYISPAELIRLRSLREFLSCFQIFEVVPSSKQSQKLKKVLRTFKLIFPVKNLICNV